ncbi:MAG: DUF4038 domain-containing protein [Clostridiales bacterium]|nr:DUF4038 domain-containing protein [Clostridiales bacterium]
MARLKVSADHQHFERDGKPFFWIGDTLWSAFTNPTFEEWEEYLDYRKAQGFNVIQINTLPQWDRVLPDLGIYPYPIREDGSMDYTAEPNMEYVARAQKLLEMAVDKGFTPALVVVWANIVPNNWLSNLFPGMVWPLEAVERHVHRVVEWFDRYDPIYFVSGDTDLRDPECAQYYRRTIEILKEEAPEALRTMHLCGGYLDLTPELADGLDFYTFQSGHDVNAIRVLSKYPAEIKERFPGKPVLNAEPCYEQMPKMVEFGKPPIGFFSADEVFETARLSILSGADAGITYGANGLWNWRHDPDRAEGPAVGIWGETAIWRDALHFPGADRMQELKTIK